MFFFLLLLHPFFLFFFFFVLFFLYLLLFVYYFLLTLGVCKFFAPPPPCKFFGPPRPETTINRVFGQTRRSSKKPPPSANPSCKSVLGTALVFERLKKGRPQMHYILRDRTKKLLENLSRRPHRNTPSPWKRSTKIHGQDFNSTLARILTLKSTKFGQDFNSTAYSIYAVGGESWPPQGADLVPSTLPAAEPSILARGKNGKLSCANRGVFRSQIPPGLGTKFPPQPLVPKMPLKTVTEISPKPLFL